MNDTSPFNKRPSPLDRNGWAPRKPDKSKQILQADPRGTFDRVFDLVFNVVIVATLVGFAWFVTRVFF